MIPFNIFSPLLSRRRLTEEVRRGRQLIKAGDLKGFSYTSFYFMKIYDDNALGRQHFWRNILRPISIQSGYRIDIVYPVEGRERVQKLQIVSPKGNEVCCFDLTDMSCLNMLYLALQKIAKWKE